jgi:pimeloyl-ACP methyl ester carboxylesterase
MLMHPLHEPWERRRVALSRITLDVLLAGPEEGPLLVLLHGFPETSASWSRELASFSTAGWRVVAPDQRGYARSDKPAGVAAYDLDRLAEDVLDLVVALGGGPFHLLGHDWGAAVAWWVASRPPPELLSVCAIAAPHPVLWRQAMEEDPVQRRMSRYVRFFGLPWLPEMLIGLTRYQGLEAAIGEAGNGPEELAAIRGAWREPGALTGMLNWYRAILHRRFTPGGHLQVDVPVTLVVGERDPYLAPHIAQRSATLGPAVQVHVVPEAGHWPH